MLFWFYAYRSLLARFRANAVSMLAICLFIVGGTLGLSYYSSLRATLVNAPSDNIIVVSKSATSEVDSRMKLDSARKVVLLDGVKQANGAPVAAREMVARVFVAQRAVGQYELANTIRGIDEQSLAIHKVKVVEGVPPAPRSFDLMVGRRLAERFPHLKIGYELAMPAGASKVTGIFSADGNSFEDEIWTERAALELHLNIKNTSSVTLVADAPAHVHDIIERINNSRDYDARAATVAEFRADTAALATVARTVLLLLVLLSFVAIFAIATTMSSAVVIRIPELAALAALGVRKRVLGRIVLLESMLLGVTGAVIGVAVSAIAIGQLGYIRLGNNPINMTLSPAVLLLGLALGVVAGMIGGIAPAMQVRRLDILTALR